MATDFDEAARQKVLLGLVRFQALYRGFKTRKILLETRREFEKIFVDIEQGIGAESLVEFDTSCSKIGGWPKMLRIVDAHSSKNEAEKPEEDTISQTMAHKSDCTKELSVDQGHVESDAKEFLLENTSNLDRVDREKALQLKNELEMELLWVRQAIDNIELIYPSVTRFAVRRKRDSPTAREDADSASSRHDSLRIQFTAFNKSFNAVLASSSRGLIAPSADIQVLGDNGTTLHAIDLEDCLYNGRLENEEDSFVSVSYCNNLGGIIETKEARYVLKASEITGHYVSGDNKPHYVQRHLNLYAQSGLATLPLFHAERRANDVASRLRKKRNAESGKLGEQTVEILLVVDPKMVNYHGLDAAKQYALTVASIAHEILRDASIGPNAINLVIVKILLLVAPQNNLAINHHAQKTLTSFGVWAGLQSKNKNSKGFDYAVLLTRYDICKDTEEPCDNSGISFIGGMCKFPTSSSVIKDNGFRSAFALAHQTGHNLGMQHDGTGNSCGGLKRVMSNNGASGENSYLWSTCSADYLQRFLRLDQSSCLQDLPAKDDGNTLDDYRNPGTAYDIDSQCKLFAGEASKGCYYGDPVEICVELLCFLPGRSSCLRTGKPAIDGTSCGLNKWCKHGRCIDKHSSHSQVIDGSWSTWSEFNTCTRPCGGGVSYRERQCQDPKPKNGGKFCEGDSREYRICNARTCKESTINFRKFQCKKKSGAFIGDKQFDWTFLGNNESSCSLVCSAETNKNITKPFGRAADGTKCHNQERDVQGRCVSGHCTPVGCNLVLGSTDKVDRCGVCNGDGSSCEGQMNSTDLTKPVVHVNITDKRSRPVGYNGIILNATNATQLAGSNVNTSVASSTVSNQTIAAANNVTINNDTTTTNSTGDMEHISNVLQKLKTLRGFMRTILRRRCAGEMKCLARFKYFDLKRKRTEVPTASKFEWAVLSSGCSVTCGVGTATLYAKCRRIDDGSPVAEKYCNQKLKPPLRTKACHMAHCPTRWATGDWDSCTRTCGGGIQTRDIYCVKYVNEDFLLSDEMCDASRRPAEKQICNKETCPPKWVTKPFGKCSTTCGKGVQLREVFCSVGKAFGHKEIVTDENCEATSKPQRELLCNVHNPCPGDDHCGGNFTEDSGIVTSPGYPEKYPNNKECTNEITVASDKSIMLELTELKIGDVADFAGNCGGDFLRVTDGGCEDALHLPFTSYCGMEIPGQVFISTRNKLCLKFVSDDAESNKGYSIKYNAVDKQQNDAKFVDICDVKGQTINSSFGAVNSPNYPDIYPTNEHCKLTVSAHDTSGFVISFKGFNVGTKSGGRCVDDYLQIQHDGTKIQLCGNDANRSEISTVASRFVISFHSADVRVAGIGFVLTYITKKFLREQFELINKRKQETLLGAGNAPYPPLVNDVPASRFRNAKDKPILRVTALTSLKKNVINQANTTSNNSKPATSSLSLEHVLQLLAGMLYDCVTDFSSLYQGSSKAKNVTKSKTAISKDATQYEDYTKAGIYKRVGIPSDIQSNNKQSNKSQTLFKQLPARQQSSNLLSKPVYPLRMGSRQWYDRSSIEHATPKTLSSAEEWKMYWNACKEINSRRSSIPKRTFTKGSVYWPQYYSYNALRSYPTRGYGATTKFNAISRACPDTNTLLCSNVALSYPCNSIANCGYHPRMNCCGTLCPHKPSVCIWT
eukprot:gene15856-17454_t